MRISLNKGRVLFDRTSVNGTEIRNKVPGDVKQEDQGDGPEALSDVCCSIQRVYKQKAKREGANKGVRSHTRNPPVVEGDNSEVAYPH